MSDDTISRQAAVDAFDGTKVDEIDCTEYDIGYNDGIDFAVSTLSVLPSAQRTGRWIYNDEAYPGGNPYGHYECDQCGEYVPHKTNYCPNCGADMRGEQDDESRSKSNAQTDTRARGMGTTDKSSGI